MRFYIITLFLFFSLCFSFGYLFSKSYLNSSDNASISYLSLEDRYVNLLEALSENGTMLYDVEIMANLKENSYPDSITIIIYLKKGEVVKQK